MADKPPNQPAAGNVARRLFRRHSHLEGREHFWALLDWWEASARLRRLTLIGGPLVLALGLAGYLGYQHWARANAVRFARQWLDAGRLDRAASSVQEALVAQPGAPEPWSLASELAWRRGNKAVAASYARRAAAVSSLEPGRVIAWAEAALLAGDERQAREALGSLNAADRELPRALRVQGELARRDGQLAKAKDCFERARALDTTAGSPAAIDEVPLGIVCLGTGSQADAKQARLLLSKWADDPWWGAECLRALLADSVSRADGAEAVRLAQALRFHPRCTLGDMPVCLGALARFDEARFRVMLQPLEDRSRANPVAAAQLLGWLNSEGQWAEADRWSQALEGAVLTSPPVAQARAESLRGLARWADLREWVAARVWAPETGFMRASYGMLACLRLGDPVQAEAYWDAIQADGRAVPGHALVAGDVLYSWGLQDRAEQMLWLAAERADLAYQALGTLARLYQVGRNGSGQFRAFERLHALRPEDRNIANNFAFYAALTNHGSLWSVLQAAKDNVEKEPENATFRCTYAVVLLWGGQTVQALDLMEPLKKSWRESPAVAFAYGSALAASGHKEEATPILHSLDPGRLDTEAVDWIRTALR